MLGKTNSSPPPPPEGVQWKSVENVYGGEAIISYIDQPLPLSIVIVGYDLGGAIFGSTVLNYNTTSESFEYDGNTPISIRVDLNEKVIKLYWRITIEVKTIKYCFLPAVQGG